MKFKKFFATISAAVMITTALGATTAHATDIPDLNGDGTINISDAVYIHGYLHGKYEPVDISIMDIDGNGLISGMDILCIQLYVAGVWEG